MKKSVCVCVCARAYHRTFRTVFAASSENKLLLIFLNISHYHFDLITRQPWLEVKWLFQDDFINDLEFLSYFTHLQNSTVNSSLRHFPWFLEYHPLLAFMPSASLFYSFILLLFSSILFFFIFSSFFSFILSAF